MKNELGFSTTNPTMIMLLIVKNLEIKKNVAKFFWKCSGNLTIFFNTKILNSFSKKANKGFCWNDIWIFNNGFYDNTIVIPKNLEMRRLD